MSVLPGRVGLRVQRTAHIRACPHTHMLVPTRVQAQELVTGFKALLEEQQRSSDTERAAAVRG